MFICQVSSIEQEILSLINRVSHPNLTHYLAVNVQESTPSVKVQVMKLRILVISLQVPEKTAESGCYSDNKI